MTARRSVIIALLAFFEAGAVARAETNLTGKWEIESVGVDKEVILEHNGTELAAHRVLRPSFEGEKYELEHLFRGTIADGRIVGQLFVREGAESEYEPLREFEGTVHMATQITLDGMILRRVGDSDATESEQLAAAKERAREAEQSPASPSAPSEPAGLGKGSSKSRKKKLLVAKVKKPLTAEARRLAKRGDAEYRAKRYGKALRLYERAARSTRTVPVALLHRLGRAHLKRGAHGEATKWLRRALRFDPTNAVIRRELDKAKKKR